MAITEIVEGAFHTIISSAGSLSAAMTELTDHLAKNKIAGHRVLEIDGTLQMVVYYNAQ